MSTRNAKTLPPEQRADPTAASAATAPRDMASAVVRAQTIVAPADALRGQGGLYTVKDGKRVLVEATQYQAAKEQA